MGTGLLLDKPIVKKISASHPRPMRVANKKEVSVRISRIFAVGLVMALTGPFLAGCLSHDQEVRENETEQDQLQDGLHDGMAWAKARPGRQPTDADIRQAWQGRYHESAPSAQFGNFGWTDYRNNFLAGVETAKSHPAPLYTPPNISAGGA